MNVSVIYQHLSFVFVVAHLIAGVDVGFISFATILKYVLPLRQTWACIKL